MPKIGTVRCGARTELDNLLFSVEVSVNKDGVFTTTLDEGTVTRLKEYGLPMKANRLGRLGYFESDTYEGLIKSINDFARECLSAELIEEKEVIQYNITTNCHFCEGDEQDGYETYPNGIWLPERLKENYGNRWRDGTEKNSDTKPYSLSIFFRVAKKQVWKFQSGRTVVKYQPAHEDSSRTSVNWLKSIVRCGPGGWGTSNPWDRPSIKEVDATEENANLFVQVFKFIFKANRIFSALSDPESLLDIAAKGIPLKITQ